MDALQRIHAMLNLADVYKSLSEESKAELARTQGRTSNEDSLLDEARTLRSLYIANPENKLAAVTAKWKEATRKSKELDLLRYRGRKKSDNEWWNDAMEAIGEKSQNADTGFVRWMREELTQKEPQEMQSKGYVSIAQRFNSLPTLAYVIFQRMKSLYNKRKAIMGRLEELETKCSRDDVDLSGNCKRCRPNKTGPMCDHCKAHVLLMDYENELYRYRTQLKRGGTQKEKGRKKGDDEDTTFGSFRESSDLENILTLFVRYLSTDRLWGNTSDADSEKVRRGLIEEGQMQIKAFKYLKEELKVAHEVWTFQKDRLSALDELEMAHLRLRLRLPGEHVPPEEENIRLWPGQVEEMKQRYAILLRQKKNTVLLLCLEIYFIRFTLSEHFVAV